MKTRTIFLLLLAISLLLFGSCQKMAEKATEKAIEAGSEGQVDVDMSGQDMKITDKESGDTYEFKGEDEGGTWTATSEDGNVKTTVTAGESASVPDGWPDSFPVYTGAKLLAATESGDGSDQVYHLSLQTTDSMDDVAAFYISKAEAAGFNKDSEFKMGEGQSYVFSKDKESFNLTLSTEDKQTNAALMYMKSQ